MPTEINETFATPTLDSGVLPALPRRNRAKRGFAGILFLLAGIIVMLPVIAWIDANKNLKVGFILLIAALLSSIVVHKIGHFIAARIAGFRSDPENRKLKWRQRQEMFGMSFTGAHLKTVRRLRRHLLTYFGGGAAANLISILPAVFLTEHFSLGISRTVSGALAAQFAVFSLLGATVTLLPIWAPLAPLRTDGDRIAMLLRSRDRSGRYLSIFALANLYDTGTRPREWKRRWVQSAASIQDGSFDEISGEWLAYMAASDREDRGIAAIHFERCLELAGILPAPLRDLIAQEAAYFAAWFRDDASLADQWRAQVKKPQKLAPLVRIRLNVAIRCVHRDYEATEHFWQEGLALIERAAVGPVRERLRDSWLEWRAEIEDRKSKRTALPGHID